MNDEIHNALKKKGFSFADLDLIAVTNGPGSFTGIRVSGNIAKTMAYAAKKKLWVTDSLSVLKEQAISNSDVFCCLNAFKNMVFVSVYKNHKLVDGPTVITNENANSYLVKHFAQSPFAVIGNGWQDLKHKLSQGLIDHVEFNPQLTHWPSAQTLGQMAFKNKNQTFEWNSYVPLYLRSSEAEENLRLRVSESK
jgi:tRNA threonylcarbamoyl adenosine modification protein YeaZ